LSERTRSFLIAGYVLLAVLLGGSSQGMWANLSLQLLGIVLIAWAAITRPPEGWSGGSRTLRGLLVAALILILLQLVPLPPEAWTKLPGREMIAEGYKQIGYGLPSLPVSLTPFQSMMALFAAIPAIAALVATEKVRPLQRWIAIVILAGTLLGILLGALQVAGGQGSWAYLYRITNDGAVGFFSNRNHMATLLLIAIPMAAALVGSARSRSRSTHLGRYGVAAAVLVLIFVGIALNRSLAAISLALPVLLASAAVTPGAVRWRRITLPLAGIALGGGILLLASTPIATVVRPGGTDTSIQSRQAIWSNTASAIRDSFPVGTGLGSFEQVYRHYEDPLTVTTVYVNHAHNDYLQIALEFGLAGLLLVIFFLVWWAVVAVRIWQSPMSTPFARAATIASAVVLVHSVVDYPLRTAAISVIFAASVGIMAQHLRSAPVRRRGEARPTRHVEIG
jgi:O-antigen ligase